MKYFLKIFTLCLGMLPLSSWAQPSSAEEFLAAYRSAFEEKNAEKLDALTYMGGMSEEDKQRVARDNRRVISEKEEIESISLEPLPEDLSLVHIYQGKKIEPNYPPVGLVTVKYKKNEHGWAGSSSLPYAVIDGRYFRISAKSTDLGWRGPPDKELAFHIVGKGQNEVTAKAKWNASGIEQERIHKGGSCFFMGQHFESVIVTSTQDDTDVTLRVVEDGKDVFSAPLKGKGTLEYSPTASTP